MSISASSGGGTRRRSHVISQWNKREEGGEEERGGGIRKKGEGRSGKTMMTIIAQIIFVIPCPPPGSRSMPHRK